jgi:transposase
MGRSRGGLTTKIHALVDACGLPILLKLTEGQAHDGRSAQDMLGTLGCGDVLLGDRAYDSDALRQDLAARGARANVRLMPNRTNLPPFNKRLYRRRNLVERFFNKLKHFRAPSQPDTTNATTTISPASSSPQSEFGCALMSR